MPSDRPAASKLRAFCVGPESGPGLFKPEGNWNPRSARHSDRTQRVLLKELAAGEPYRFDGTESPRIAERR